MTAGGPPLFPGLLLTDLSFQPGFTPNDDQNPLIISVQESSPPLGVEPLVGRVMKVYVNQNKLIRKYLTPVGSTPPTPSELPPVPTDLKEITLRLDPTMFLRNSLERYCIVVECRQRKIEFLPPLITIVLITDFSETPLEDVLVPEEFKRAMPISPTVALPGTPNPLHTSPEWMPHPKHKTPSYVLCVPIQARPVDLINCDDDEKTVIDADNLSRLKLHLLSLGGLVANADYVDSDESEDEDGGSECSYVRL